MEIPHKDLSPHDHFILAAIATSNTTRLQELLNDVTDERLMSIRFGEIEADSGGNRMIRLGYEPRFTAGIDETLFSNANFLQVACFLGNLQAVKLLHARMGREGLVHQDARGRTSLHIALNWHPFTELVGYLLDNLEDEDLLITDNRGTPAHILAFYSGSFPDIERLSKRLTRDQLTEIYDSEGHNCVNALMTHGDRHGVMVFLIDKLLDEDLFHRFTRELSPLHVACQNRNVGLLQKMLPRIRSEWILERYEPVVRPDCVFERGEGLGNLIDIAIEMGQSDILKMLLAVLPVESWPDTIHTCFRSFLGANSDGGAFFIRDNQTAEEIIGHYGNDFPRSRKLWRKRYGLNIHDANEVFAMIVCFCDGYFELDEDKMKEDPELRSFFDITTQLPMELQAIVCHRVYESSSNLQPTKAKLDPILCKLLNE